MEGNDFGGSVNGDDDGYVSDDGSGDVNGDVLCSDVYDSCCITFVGIDNSADDVCELFLRGGL